jgi:hypothetical protein
LALSPEFTFCAVTPPCWLFDVILISFMLTLP